MASGVPIIASDIPVLREIGGDAVTYVDPLDPIGLSVRMNALATSSRRGALVRAGIERSRLYSWKSAAESFLPIYQEAMSEARSTW
jgi:glycosyltransferase involved in cell wall biosynthesis